MPIKTMLRFLFAALILLVLWSVSQPQAATNLIGASRRADLSTPSQLADFLPMECTGMPVIRLITNSNGLTPTSDFDFILGTAMVDKINGLEGDDCIVGGAGNDWLGPDPSDKKGGGSVNGKGNDTILGGSGDDTLVGGVGNDTFYGGDGYDSCTGGGGKDQFYGCEVTR